MNRIIIDNGNQYFKEDIENLHCKFNGVENIESNCSQAFQDIFVLSILNGKTSGKYIEIGANHPIKLNNTFLLETQYNWKGISIEINNNLVNQFNASRDQKCICSDATTFDWVSEFKNKKWRTKRIDYASIDCEPSMTTYEALINLPHNEYRFSVITYETDYYRDGPQARDLQRSFLTDLGYKLVVSDLCNLGNPFEDWWVDPQVISEKIWKPFESVNVEARSLFIK